jgi:hypothetical protein
MFSQVISNFVAGNLLVEALERTYIGRRSEAQPVDHRACQKKPTHLLQNRQHLLRSAVSVCHDAVRPPFVETMAC